MMFPLHPIVLIAGGALFAAIALVIVGVALIQAASRLLDERELLDLTVDRELSREVPAPVFPIAMQRARRDADHARRNGIGRPR